MTYRILSIAIMLGIGINASAQQTDPALVGAVGVQTAMLKDIFSDREKTQQKIIAAEVAVTVAMDRMHQVENKMLDYLSNAQGAMQNLYQIKRAAELVTTEIPQNMNLVRKSVPGHLKGTAIALLVSDELTDAATQMASLFPFMKQLVTSGTYNVDGYDSQGNPTTEKHKVNLLNLQNATMWPTKSYQSSKPSIQTSGCWHGRSGHCPGKTCGMDWTPKAGRL